jgi:hypothetical protein
MTLSWPAVQYFIEEYEEGEERMLVRFVAEKMSARVVE